MKKIVVDHMKAVIFVAHIQRHLDNDETIIPQQRDRGHPVQSIPNGEVGCKICNKGIHQIALEDRHKQDWIVA